MRTRARKQMVIDDLTLMVMFFNGYQFTLRTQRFLFALFLMQSPLLCR